MKHACTTQCQVQQMFRVVERVHFHLCAISGGQNKTCWSAVLNSTRSMKDKLRHDPGIYHRNIVQGDFNQCFVCVYIVYCVGEPGCHGGDKHPRWDGYPLARVGKNNF